MTAINGAVFANANNVVPPQTSLVDARGSDPDVAICISNGKIASGRGGHPIAIDAIHHLHEFIAGMEELGSLIHTCLKAPSPRLAQTWIVDAGPLVSSALLEDFGFVFSHALEPLHTRRHTASVTI